MTKVDHVNCLLKIYECLIEEVVIFPGKIAKKNGRSLLYEGLVEMVGTDGLHADGILE